ncbi:MAG: hypothetical protein WBA25_17240 [Jannaschia sp.]
MTSARDLVCPVVLRQSGEAKSLLVYEHPNGSINLLIEEVEAGEAPAHASGRVLQDESGLEPVLLPQLLMTDRSHPGVAACHFFQCEVYGDLPEQWVFEPVNVGGNGYRFFWHEIGEQLTPKWDVEATMFMESLRPHLED